MEQVRPSASGGDEEHSGEWWIIPQSVTTVTLDAPASPPQPPTAVEPAAVTAPPVSMETDDPMEGPRMAPLRRTQRGTAGRHTNPHHLPATVWRWTGAATSRVPGSGNMISAISRLWN